MSIALVVYVYRYPRADRDDAQVEKAGRDKLRRTGASLVRTARSNENRTVGVGGGREALVEFPMALSFQRSPATRQGPHEIRHKSK